MAPGTTRPSEDHADESLPFRNMELLKYLETFASHLSIERVHTDSNKLYPKIRPPPGKSYGSVLTAFAQLGAQRLKAKRCLISLIDDAHQYVLAESTRSLSLRSNDVHDEDDGLWLGCSILDRSKSVCNYTVDLEVPGGIPSVEDSSEIPILVFNDLTKEELFKDDEHVIGHPHLRFYAGVPIYIPNTKISIGTYCILDDKPHVGKLDTAAVAFMQDMSVTIITFLELARANKEHEGSDKMIRGIGCFVDGQTRFSDEWPRKDSQPHVGTKRERTRTSSELEVSSAKRSHTYDSNADGPQKSSNDLLHPSGSKQVSRNTTSDTPSSTVEGIFSRASTILRQATDMSGVVFLDAAFAMPSIKTSPVPKQRPSRRGSFASHGSDSDSDENSYRATHGDEDSAVLGLSIVGHNHDDSFTPRVSKYLLAKLLQRYPRGKIFNLDASLSDHPQGLLTPLAQTDPFQNGYLNIVKSLVEEPRVKHTTRLNEHTALAKAFPGAQRIAFYPLWDNHKDQWYAGTLTYTCKPTRLVSLKDLGYLAAFGTNIMAEVSRVATANADQAKANFISSISHELRSPLHGILGSVEFLQTTAVNAFQGNMIHTVETCARTLLDTINHLLNFAKTSNFTRPAGRLGASERSKSGIGKASFGHMNLESDLDLRILIEEVVQTVFLGHDFQYLSKSRDKYSNILSDETTAGSHELVKKQVLVLLDIKPATSHIFHSNGGALRRILMNLSGNSLKYCEAGYIRVALESKDAFQEDGVTKAHVTLTVSDSGKGISQDYIRDKLFTPFAQEDSLAPGTGLGLSMIKQIVESLHGTIEVESEQGKGTEVKIRLTLTGAIESSDPVERRDHQEVAGVAQKTSGWTVCMVGFSRASDEMDLEHISPQERAGHLWAAAAGRLCTDWFNMKTEWELNPQRLPQLFMVTPEGAEELMACIKHQESSSEPSTIDTPIIMVCRNAAAALYMAEHSPLGLHGTTVEFISQPFGPQKLSKVLSLILERQSGKLRGQQTVSMQGVVSPMTTDAAKAMHGESSFQQKAAPIYPRQQSQEQTQRTANDVSAVAGLDVKAESEASPSSVLIVDDNPINRQLLVTFAQKQNLPYATASNGLEAVNAYRDTHGSYDVVLMDVTMPVMNGLEATERIRKHESENAMRPALIVALTGLTAEEDHERASESGVDLFLEKPVRLRDLAKLLADRKAGDTAKSSTKV